MDPPKILTPSPLLVIGRTPLPPQIWPTATLWSVTIPWWAISVNLNSGARTFLSFCFAFWRALAFHLPQIEYGFSLVHLIYILCALTHDHCASTLCRGFPVCVCTKNHAKVLIRPVKSFRVTGLPLCFGFFSVQVHLCKGSPVQCTQVTQANRLR